MLTRRNFLLGSAAIVAGAAFLPALGSAPTFDETPRALSGLGLWVEEQRFRVSPARSEDFSAVGWDNDAVKALTAT